MRQLHAWLVPFEARLVIHSRGFCLKSQKSVKCALNLAPDLGCLSLRTGCGWRLTERIQVLNTRCLSMRMGDEWRPIDGDKVQVLSDSHWKRLHSGTLVSLQWSSWVQGLDSACMEREIPSPATYPHGKTPLRGNTNFLILYAFAGSWKN